MDRVWTQVQVGKRRHRWPLRATPETFVVEEIPAYLPAGEGEHTYLWIEKRGLTTPEAVRRLARALGVSPTGRRLRRA